MPILDWKVSSETGFGQIVTELVDGYVETHHLSCRGRMLICKVREDLAIEDGEILSNYYCFLVRAISQHMSEYAGDGSSIH